MTAPTNPSFTPKWYDSSFMVVVALLLFFPVGLYALFKNRRLGAGGKFLLGGAVMFFMAVTAGLMGIGGYWLMRTSPAFQKSVQTLTGGGSNVQGSRASRQDAAVAESNPATRIVSLKSDDSSKDLASVVQVPARNPGRPEEPLPPAPADSALAQAAAAAATARELEKGVSDAQAEQRLFAVMQQKQADEYEHTLIDLAAATSDAQRTAARQKLAAMNDTDGRVRDYYDRLAQKIDDLNQRMASAGKPRLAPLEPDAQAQRRIEGARASFAALASNPQPLAVAPTPPRVFAPPPVSPPVAQFPPSAIADPPRRVIVVAPAVSSADMIGGWRRADNKVSWVFNPRGTMSSHMSGQSAGGTWALDEKASQLNVILNGFNYNFTVTRANNVLIMDGSVGGGSAPLHFLKAVK